jgi:ParB-like chromosome segregation protein Spo0J
MLTSNVTELLKFDDIDRDESGKYREDYSEEDIRNLAENIKAIGMLNPLTVRVELDDDDDKVYHLLAGGRRMAAIEMLIEEYNEIEDEEVLEELEVTKEFIDEGIRCSLCAADEDQDVIAIVLAENYQRSDMDADNEAQAVYDMLQTGMVGKDVGSMLGMSEASVSLARTYVENASKAIRRKVRKGELGINAARTLIKGNKTEKKQLKALKDMESESGGKGKGQGKAAKKATGSATSTRPSASELNNELEATEAAINKAAESDDEDKGKDSPVFFRLMGRRDGLLLALGKGKIKRLYKKPKKAKKAKADKKTDKKDDKKAAKKASKKSSKKSKVSKKTKKNLPTED